MNLLFLMNFSLSKEPSHSCIDPQWETQSNHLQLALTWYCRAQGSHKLGLCPCMQVQGLRQALCMYMPDDYCRFSQAMIQLGKTAQQPSPKGLKRSRPNIKFVSSYKHDNIPAQSEPAQQYDSSPHSKALPDFCSSCKSIHWSRATCKSQDSLEPDYREHTESSIMRFSSLGCCLCAQTCSLGLSMCREGTRSFLELLT